MRGAPEDCHVKQELLKKIFGLSVPGPPTFFHLNSLPSLCETTSLVTRQALLGLLRSTKSSSLQLDSWLAFLTSRDSTTYFSKALNSSCWASSQSGTSPSRPATSFNMSDLALAPWQCQSRRQKTHAFQTDCKTVRQLLFLQTQSFNKKFLYNLRWFEPDKGNENAILRSPPKTSNKQKREATTTWYQQRQPRLVDKPSHVQRAHT